MKFRQNYIHVAEVLAYITAWIKTGRETMKKKLGKQGEDRRPDYLPPRATEYCAHYRSEAGNWI
jgi:hypothetical protein